MPKIDIVLCPVTVQGVTAAQDIARGLDLMDRYGHVDVILVGRGGGSLEDLWAFNEEKVAYAIYRCNTPVISCVGHEIDTTIADFVADVRAATPSNGAEIAVPVYTEMYDRVDSLEMRLRRAMTNGQTLRRGKLERLTACLSAPRDILIEKNVHKLEKLEMRLRDAWEKQQLRRSSRVDTLARTLQAIDPGRVIDRGYAYVEQNGKILSDAARIERPGTITVHMRDGALQAALTEENEK